MLNASNFVMGMLFVCVASVAPGSASPQQDCGNPCGKPTAWQDFNSFTLKTSIPGQSAYSKWQGKFDAKSNDIQVDVEHSQSGSIIRGKILMIGGRVMAIQGPIATPDHEIDALDGVVLELQLVMKLLGRALPSGPASVSSAKAIDYTDTKTGVKVATQSAGETFQPPWRVAGKLKKVGPDAIEFSLTFTSRNDQAPGAEKQEQITLFEGMLFNTRNAKIDDQFNLETWKLFDVGPQSRNQKGATIIDFSAAPLIGTYKTVADVHKNIELGNYVGEPDTAKDFTGFWKTDCEDGFGLQIKHYGTDGKYSIVFCGPGGCGNPANEGRKTFITKDSHFQVISEDELKEQSGGGWETYHRCTRDTHPVLKDREP